MTQNIFLDTTRPLKTIKQWVPKVREGSDYQLVTPSMRLYLPHVKARLRGIIALKAYVASQAIITNIPCNIDNKRDNIVGLHSPLHTIHKLIHTSSKIHTYTDYGQDPNENKITPNARSPIVPTGLHY